MTLIKKIRALFRRGKLDREMSYEMRLHVELQTERNLAAGMNPEEARFAAQRLFGHTAGIQERAREQRAGLWLDHLQRDVRHGWRMLAKAPMLSSIIILSLGIGIGANTVIFSWIRGVVFRPLPGVAHADQFLLVEPRTETGSNPGASWPEYEDLRRQLTSFDELLAFRMLPLNQGDPGKQDRVYSQLVSANYFSGLGLRPAMGRFLRADEVDQPGGGPIAVISYDYWQTHFAGADDVIGRSIRLNERELAIVGVAPEGFRGTVIGLSFDLWVPVTMAPALLGDSRELQQRDVRGYSVMGRLRPGVTETQARTELDTAMRELAHSYPATNAAVGAEILSFWRAPRGAPRFLFGGLAALQGFMVLVLLVVCANAANLLLARSTARRREIGVRLALGARPGQILRLFLIESLGLGAVASAVGVLLAVWGTNALRAVPMPTGIPFKFQTDLEFGGLLFAVALGLGCALLFGLVPALQSARTDSQLALRTARLAIGGSRVRSVLVALEVALALLVLVVAALFMGSFLETRTADTGFKAEGVLLAGYDLSSAGYSKPAALAVMDTLLQRLNQVPGIAASGVASWVPLDLHSMPAAGFKLDGRERSDGGLERALSYTVTPGYFKAMGLPIVAGRDFAALTDTKQPLQAVVNEEFVRHFLAGAPALGHRIGGQNVSFEIVGVVRNSLYETFGEPAKPLVYFSYRDRFSPIGQIHVRVQGTEAAMAPNLRRIVRDINPTVALYDVRSLTEHVDKNLVFRRIPARLFVVLGPLILLLAAIGIYAVVAYSVAQRTTEIGVRLALGASHRGVVRQIVGESMRVVWIGATPAWLLAVVVMLHLRGGVLNATVLLGVPGLLMLVATVASWLPARRAARVDPVVALRAE